MTYVRRLVLDVLKPHDPNTIEVSIKINSIKGISFVNAVSEEVDQETESLKITIEGSNLKYAEIKDIIEECGCAVHSIDEVSVTKRPDSFSRNKFKSNSKK